MTELEIMHEIKNKINSEFPHGNCLKVLQSKYSNWLRVTGHLLLAEGWEILISKGKCPELYEHDKTLHWYYRAGKAREQLQDILTNESYINRNLKVGYGFNNYFDAMQYVAAVYTIENYSFLDPLCEELFSDCILS